MNELKKIKQLFDLCNDNEGIIGKVHIINTSDNPHDLEDVKKEFRVYQGDGYCFDVSREPVELEDGESNDNVIDGFEYQFMEGIYDGFKDVTIAEALILIKRELTLAK